MMTTRRQALRIAAGAGLAWHPSGAASLDWKEVAAAHVRIAEKTRQPNTFWGRVGGSAAERESARLCARQLRPFVKTATTERFQFTAHRTATWVFRSGERTFPSAMPAPFDARFPDAEVEGEEVEGELVAAQPGADWAPHRGKWIFVAGEQGRAVANTIVREKLLYQKAVAAGAIGFVFSVATPADDTWQCVVPVDKAYAVKDERYPDGRRPIPCFCVDSRDGLQLLRTARLRAHVQYQKALVHLAENAVGILPGSSPGTSHSRRGIAIMCHLDSFFSGACDNATGIATMIGIARRLAALPSPARKADFHFLGLAAHHDAGAGMRAFLDRDPARSRSIGQMILIEHTDVLDLPMAKQAGWPLPLNDQRTAYLGPDGWPEVKSALGRLVRASGLMAKDPQTQDACIADLYVNCGKVKSFCLMNAPPIYHTNHDTLEWISAGGIERAVDFHVRVLGEIGAISAAG